MNRNPIPESDVINHVSFNRQLKRSKRAGISRIRADVFQKAQLAHYIVIHDHMASMYNISNLRNRSCQGLKSLCSCQIVSSFPNRSIQIVITSIPMQSELNCSPTSSSNSIQSRGTTNYFTILRAEVRKIAHLISSGFDSRYSLDYAMP